MTRLTQVQEERTLAVRRNIWLTTPPIVEFLYAHVFCAPGPCVQ